MTRGESRWKAKCTESNGRLRSIKKSIVPSKSWRRKIRQEPLLVRTLLGFRNSERRKKRFPLKVRLSSHEIRQTRRAEPGARANGPERPWLILSVRPTD